MSVREAMQLVVEQREQRLARRGVAAFGAFENLPKRNIVLRAHRRRC
jgi:hypothetical protein